MAKTPQTVDAYLKALPPKPRAVLAKVRATLKRALPGSEQVISYGMPTFKRDGRAVMHFAAWKQHWALYPGSQVLSELASVLAPYETKRGTVLFPYELPVPARLLTRLARRRAAHATARASTRASRRQVR